MAEITNPTLKLAPAQEDKIRLTVSYELNLSNAEVQDFDGRYPFYMLDKAVLRGMTMPYDLNFWGDIPRTTEPVFRQASVEVPRHWFDTDALYADVQAEIVVYAQPKIGDAKFTNVVQMRSLKPRPYAPWRDVGKLVLAATGAVAAGAIAVQAIRRYRSSGPTG